MAEQCRDIADGCRYAGTDYCLITKHHLQYPRNIYNTHLEKIFRNLPENIVRISRCEHDEIHATEPAPLKPSLEVMRHAIEESRINRVLNEGVENGASQNSAESAI